MMVERGRRKALLPKDLRDTATASSRSTVEIISSAIITGRELQELPPRTCETTLAG
jgi:hypothetical protein